MDVIYIVITILLPFALLFQVIGNRINSKIASLKEELLDNKIKMTIEAQSQSMYDNRISIRSLENVTRHLLPAGTMENTIGESKTDERYTKEPLMYKEKRDQHTKRFNEIADIMNEFDPKAKKEFVRLGRFRVLTSVFEFLCIAVVLVLYLFIIF
ncbi:MAG: hypothetical protein HOE80_05000 [Candidatus Magasanikbacteria bacterium]|jgi:hypothetical protein|nr:hypothetical protein [Candidatus Magasanikbacteria bacterium]MBT4072046.1 hypothetical protein [Candidatus Magasanikbacteria bacterium]